MNQRSIVTKERPTVVVSAQGDLRIEGWERRELTVDWAGKAPAVIDSRADAIHVSGDDIIVLRVPHGTALRIDQVHGDLRIVSVQGRIKVDDVSGDITLRGTGATQMNAVGGELIARGVRGGVSVKSVAGDTSVRDVGGDFTAQRIGGRLDLQKVTGSVSAAVQEDADVILTPTSGRAYAISARGEVHCVLPTGADAIIEAHSDAQAIRVAVPRITKSETAEDKLSLTLGQGGPTVSLRATGEVVVTASEALDEADAQEGPPGESVNQLSRQLEAHAARAEKRLDETLEQLRLRLEDVPSAQEKLAGETARIRESFNRSLEQARQRAGAALLRAERMAAEAERRRAAARHSK